jgi:epoxyqueuosine reductase
MKPPKMHSLLSSIDDWVEELGFSGWGVSDMDLESEKAAFDAWLEKGHHASMLWLNENKELRFQPENLVPNTCRVISLRMNYLPEADSAIATLKSSKQSYISRYALGRDYHKLMRKRLAKLSEKIHAYATQNKLVPEGYHRVFVDSAPVLERPLAEKAGLGWQGKHTLILNEEDGSWFFLGEIFTNIPFPVNQQKRENKCGSCDACLKVCPTDAFPEPYVLDANRCISYLTIEHDGVIPEEFREPIGNRVFGCDDCQLICPWNKEAPLSEEGDFHPRHSLNNIQLADLFMWTEKEFLERTAGSALRRAGYEKFQRNIAIGLGNAEKDLRIEEALKAKRGSASPMVAEHIDWALGQQSANIRRKRKIKNPNKG